jgi:hypothetical protein
MAFFDQQPSAAGLLFPKLPLDLQKDHGRGYCGFLTKD